MNLKRTFIACSLAVAAVTAHAAESLKQNTGAEDRQIWVNTLVKVVDPVLTNLANGTLKANMPQESLSPERAGKYCHLEAVGRTLCGLAPWLELGGDDTEEGKLREKYIRLTLKGLANAVNPTSPDYLDFGTPSQPLVDAAFLAQGLLRAPKQLWGRMDETTRKRMITELKRSRGIKPFNNNWLLFASMVEAALLEFTGECDMQRLTHGVSCGLLQQFCHSAHADGRTDRDGETPNRRCREVSACPVETFHPLCRAVGASGFSRRHLSGRRAFHRLSCGGFSCACGSRVDSSVAEESPTSPSALRTDGGYQPPVCRCGHIRFGGLVAHRLCRQSDKDVRELYQYGQPLPLHVWLFAVGPVCYRPVLE